MTLLKNIAILGFRRYAALGTITASSEAAGYQAPNLANDALWNTTWRSAAGVVSAVDLVFNLGVARSVQGFALLATNLTSAAQRATWIGNDPTFAVNLDTSAMAAAFDSSIPPLLDDTPPWGRHVIYFAANPQTAQYARLRLTDAANPDGYLRGAIGILEDLWQPIHRNMAYNWSRPDSMVGQDGAQLLLRQLNIPFPALTPQEERQVRSLGRVLKGQGRVLIVPSPLAPATWPAEAIWCKFSDLGEGVGIDKGGKFRQLTLKFVEVSE